jgi:hypothetical protein
MGTLILHPHWYPLRLTADQRYGVDGSLTLAGASQTKTPPRRRITNQDAATKALIGEWQSAYVETREEQIERLTTERDGALFVRDAWKVTASILAGQHEAVSARVANAERERDAALGQVNALHKVATSSDVDRAVEHAATKVRAANAERERDAARRMVVLRSGSIKSSKEARELDALMDQAIEEGWLKVP